MKTLPIEKFHGIGKVTAGKLHEMGIFTGADLKARSLPELVEQFGKAGAQIVLSNVQALTPATIGTLVPVA